MSKREGGVQWRTTPTGGVHYEWCPSSCVTYVLEAAVKDLQLLAGEAGLGFELLQALGAMADCGEFKLIFNAVWRRGRGGRGRSGVSRCFKSAFFFKRLELETSH